jgi:hypothetical protein
MSGGDIPEVGTAINFLNSLNQNNTAFEDEGTYFKNIFLVTLYRSRDSAVGTASG